MRLIFILYTQKIKSSPIKRTSRVLGQNHYFSFYFSLFPLQHSFACYIYIYIFLYFCAYSVEHNFASRARAFLIKWAFRDVSFLCTKSPFFILLFFLLFFILYTFRDLFLSFFFIFLPLLLFSFRAFFCSARIKFVSLIFHLDFFLFSILLFLFTVTHIHSVCRVEDE